MFLIAVNDLKRSNYKQQFLLIIIILKVALSHALPLPPQPVPPNRAFRARQPLIEGAWDSAGSHRSLKLREPLCAPAYFASRM